MLYKTILADPPWSYKSKNTGGSMKSGAAQKYDTLSVAELSRLRVGDVADRDCILALWATAPLLPDALEVMGAWGFSYITNIVWLKEGRLGLGYWMRVQTEYLLIGRRGKPTPWRIAKPNIIVAKRSKHSRKPPEARELLEEVTKRPRLELFATEDVDGWRSVGFDATGEDVRHFLGGVC